MKCKNCGFENEQGYSYCVNCGEPASSPETQLVEPVSLNPVADLIMPALRDKLFLALCILMTVSCALSVIASTLPVLNILFTVFLWLTYADAQKGFANEKHLQSISGTVYANYVITNVLGIILLVCGGILLLCGIGLIGMNVTDYELTSEMLNEFAQIESSINWANIFASLGEFIFIAIAVMFLIIGALVLVINILCMRKIHRFAKSVYQGIMYQNPNFEKPEAVRNWFYVIAVCNGINVISSITAANPIMILTGICSTAISVIVITLMNKHIV